MNPIFILKYTSLIIILFALQALNGQSIVINEIAASNTTYLDENGRSSDWLELYNRSEETISISDWYLSDDASKPKKWQFPIQSIAPKEFFLLFASDKDRKTSTPFLHTNFKLKTGETLYLLDASGDLQDSLYIPAIDTDQTIGCFPDGELAYKIFTIGSPNAANNTEYFEGVITNEVVFSKTGGLQAEEIALELSGAASSQTIRYTTNGSMPTTTSTIYTNPIIINENRVIRAGIFQNGFLPSPIITHSYIVDTQHDLPVFSIAFEPKDFFDDSIGLYTLGLNHKEEHPYHGANFWVDYERPVSLSLFDNNEQKGFNANAGVKIFGGYSRANDQRSLAIFFRNDYGTKYLDYPLFDERPYTKYEAFILRNSGNDWPYSMIRDLTMTGLMENSNVDIQAGRPVATYFNGQYWGIYNIREKINEHYLAALHNIDKKEIDILEGDGYQVYGDSTSYIDLMAFVSTHDLSVEEQFQRVNAEIDLKNYIQYQIAQIYFDNTDWPGANIKFWRPKSGKWRWILFDTDFGFGNWYNDAYKNNSLQFAIAENGPTWPNPPWATLLLRKLMQNEGFKHQFINTFADELNTRFIPNQVNDRIDKNAEQIETEMPKHINKWRTTNMDYWLWNVELLRDFADLRPEFIRNHIQDEFSLPSQIAIDLSIEDISQGSIQLNSIHLQETNWTGIYFESIPITLKAIPGAGYLFDYWSGTHNSTEAIITIDPTNGTNLTAHFKRETTSITNKATDDLLMISPNPFQNSFTIQSELLTYPKAQIDLLDGLGRTIQTRVNLEKNTFSNQQYFTFPELPTGVYWLRISTADQVFLEKIIKQ